MNDKIDEEAITSLAEAFNLCYDDVVELYEQAGRNIKKLVKRVAELTNY